MNLSLVLRSTAAVALGAFAAWKAWTEVQGIQPYLSIETKRTVRTENFDIWDLRITARGGETIGEVRVEPQSPRLHLVGPGKFQGLKSGWMKVFRLEFADARDGSTARVYVSQEGPVSNTYDILLGGDR
jgi:hypothetical protein